MQLTGNTILITGGGSGIGRGLAEAFHALGNEVIIAGRRAEMLHATVAANPGIKSAVLDLDSTAGISAFAAQLSADYPHLNAVIHSAGIMRIENIFAYATADAEAIITTNLLGPIRLTSALLPLLLTKSRATIMTVSSGLAFVPLAMTPTYCATKAAIHSYSQSLRYQLRDTKIKVLEIIPPYVQTELMGDHQKTDPRAMPLDDFIAETMQILKSSPDATEICVERLDPLRSAGSSGPNYEAFFKDFNDAMMAAAAH